ncbi:GNAT family N-acetyltransferase [Streptomyces sp. NPDC093225]|uniref:GNAT family N-acetyltransferase n=1 Tax=Streptomyces sp. NPDC093225 TaxID=3366034 RepID=UPI0037FCB4F0
MFAIDLADDAQLRPLEVWHAEEFLAHMDRGREFIGQYIAFPDRAVDLDGTREFLRTNAEKAANDSTRLFGIWIEGTLRGGVLFPVFDAAGGNAEVGCWMEPAGAGRGLITKACGVLIDHAVHVRGIHRLEWHVCTENEKSIAVAKRLGFTLEGVQRENYLHRGRRQSTEVWSLLAPEWRSAAS